MGYFEAKLRILKLKLAKSKKEQEEDVDVEKVGDVVESNNDEENDTE